MTNLQSKNNNNSIPQVSIIIPVYNNFLLTMNCIDSINNAKLKTSYEIIIADDGSTDDTVNIEKYYNNVRLIRTPQNMGFLMNVKNAIPYAKGSYILLMNNDMIAKPKFLDYLYNTIRKNNKIGIVGAMMLYEDDTIQEAGATLLVDGSAKWNCNGYEKINTLKTYEVDYCSGCGILFSKEDWNKLGGFDERYAPAYYEDTDFCCQIKYFLGKKVILQPKAQIYHLHGKTYNEKAENMMARNRTKFLEKWDDKLYKRKDHPKESTLDTSSFAVYNDGTHKIIYLLGIKFKFKSKKIMQANGRSCNSFLENIFSIKNEYNHKVVTLLGLKLKIKYKKDTHNVNNNKLNDFIQNNNIKLSYLELLYRKNTLKLDNTILYMDWNIMEPDTNAGDRASYSYLKALLNYGYNIIYLPQSIQQNIKPEYIDLIKDYGVEILTDAYGNINYDYLKSWFQKNGKFIDYVFINRPTVYTQYELLIEKYLTNAKKIYQGHDIHFLRLSRMAEIEKQKINWADIEQMKKLELSIWEKMDVILYFSEKEIEIVKSYFPDANALSVPIFLYSNVDKMNYNPESRKNLLFVGGFKHTPNVDAMKWFINDIFPTVLKSNPDIKLNIVGADFPQDIIYNNKNIIVHGFLSDKDLQHLYNQTKLVISPLRYGAGIKGKIIEAMKNQIPVITTDIGAEGITSNSLIVANTEEEFANKILKLYTNNEELEKISNDYYYYIKEHFSEKFMDKLIKYINNCCN